MSRLEADLRSELCRGLRARGVDTQPVENELEGGFPDVVYAGWFNTKTSRGHESLYVEGVIETKVGDWPRQKEARFFVAHRERFFQQTAWLLRRWKAGGRAHVLLEMGDATSLHLLTAPRARELALHGATRHELCFLLSEWVWYRGQQRKPWDDLLDALERSRP